MLGLHWCTQAFSTCGIQGLVYTCDMWASHSGGFSWCGLLMVGASHGGASHGVGFSRCGLLLLQSMGSRGSRFYLLRHVGSVVAAQGL